MRYNEKLSFANDNKQMRQYVFQAANHSYCLFFIYLCSKQNEDYDIELGKFNQLEVVKQVDFGMYLDGGEEGEILLPTVMYPKIVSWETG